MASAQPEYGFTLPGMVELLRQWNLYTDTRVKEHYDNYRLLKDVLHRPRQRSLDELRNIKYEEFLGELLTHIIHFRADGTARRIDRQSTIDRGSKAKRSFVSFSLCGTPGHTQPLALKGRRPFSRHQRSPALF